MMIRKLVAGTAILFVSCLGAYAQDFQKCVTNNTFHFVNMQDPDVLLSIRPASPPDGPFVDDELEELHRIQDNRTTQEVDQANKDAGELDIYIFQSIVGNSFNASNPELPATTKLSQDLCEEATTVSNRFKAEFHRDRPFNSDSSLKPATDISFLKTSPSYPSGHSLTGYLEALALAKILPNKRELIMKRASEFAYNRMVLGVHYGSDLAAGRLIAYNLLVQISKNPKFEKEFSAAQSEIRTRFPN